MSCIGAGRQRVHPLTPVLRAWMGLTAVLVAVAINSGAAVISAAAAVSDLADGTPLLAVLAVFAGLIAIVALIAGISYWSWSKRFYELDVEEIRIGSGIFFRQRRSARYDRLQSVDIKQPLLPRLFGLGELTLETAGGSGSALSIAYLKVPLLESLRTEILAHAKGEQHDPLPDAHPESTTLNGPVPTRMLVGMVLLSFGVWAVLALIGAGIGSIAGGGIFTFVGGLVGAVVLVWAPLNRRWRQELSLNREERRLRITAGLTSTYKQTIPLHRVHALRIRRPFLWRKPNWADLNSSIAGYGLESSGDGATVLVPVDKNAAVDRTVETVLAEVNVGKRDPFLTMYSPPSAKWVSPVDWRQQSVSLSTGGMEVTWGRLTTRWAFVPWRHIQGASLQRGPIQKLLGTANVQAAVVAGPAQVVARDLSVDDARALLDEILKDRLDSI